MKKLFSLRLLTCFLLLGGALLTSSVYFSTELVEFRLLTLKYCEKNIPKQDKWRKRILHVIHFTADLLLPSIQPQNISKNAIDLTKNVNAIRSHTNINVIQVTTVDELREALLKARPGEQILLLEGIYKLKGKPLKLRSSGQIGLPIVLKGEGENTVLELDIVEGIRLDKSHWVIENLVFNGVCDLDKKCEHAIHISGNSDNIVIRNNIFKNFNAHIKSNGRIKDNIGFPDNIVIENNIFFNEWRRQTRLPVTPIDVVGGNYWIIRNNIIADFSKDNKSGRGNTVSYGLFLKGAGQNGLIEKNIILCEWDVKHEKTIDIRIGISLGGGGTETKYCQDRTCEYEHQNGIIKDNTILNCINDVGIYLNKASQTQLLSNTINHSLGIDVRYKESSTIIQDNIIHGRIKKRDGASVQILNNIINSLNFW